jgi:YHS domain-containing protein
MTRETFDSRMKKAQLALATIVLFALATISFGAEAAKPALTKVEPKTVCMITEHAMGKPQIPVTVDGKTYYGCCDMCKKTLATDATKRVATDPQSGAEVDKAVAVIAADADGKIFYFENEKNLKAYNAKLAKSAEKK